MAHLILLDLVMRYRLIRRLLGISSSPKSSQPSQLSQPTFSTEVDNG